MRWQVWLMAQEITAHHSLHDEHHARHQVAGAGDLATPSIVPPLSVRASSSFNLEVCAVLETCPNWKPLMSLMLSGLLRGQLILQTWLCGCQLSWAAARSALRANLQSLVQHGSITVVICW